ncbi:GPO family capsid scaffolding protein [Aeromonas jandaei]
MATPIDSSLRTGWVAVATEGETMDGRVITATEITDMATTYDPDFYCAQLWPEHEHRWENMGYVEALKTDTVDGKLTLFAVLSPTSDLVYQNRRGQLRFCSVEIWPNFAGSGKNYLFGIGVTNLPASTGTSMLKFSAKHPERLVGKSMALDLSSFSLPDSDDSPDRIGLLHKMFNYLAGHGSNPTPAKPTPEDDTEMTKEQMDQLAGMFSTLGTQIETFSAKVDSIGKPAEAPTADPARAPVPAADPAPAFAITAEQFSALEKTIKGYETQLTALNEKIEAFSVEVPGQRPDGLGGKDTTVTIC